jgi:hypothetical protein
MKTDEVITLKAKSLYDVMLSWRLTLMKASRVIRRVNSLNDTNVMLGTDMVPETSVIFVELTKLIARKDFINE